MIRYIKRLIYRMTTNKDKIIQNKLQSIIEVTGRIPLTSAKERVIATPSGDFLLVSGPELTPIVMVQSDDLGLEYTIVFNSAMELTVSTAHLSSLFKANLSVVKEMTIELAFDTINKRILVGEDAVQYNKKDNTPGLTLVN